MKWYFCDRRIDGNNAKLPSSFYIKCGLCGEVIKVYTWSFAGSGKKCPKCGVVHYLSEVYKGLIYKKGR